MKFTVNLVMALLTISFIAAVVPKSDSSGRKACSSQEPKLHIKFFDKKPMPQQPGDCDFKNEGRASSRVSYSRSNKISPVS
jgi:hypothetical protein